MENDKVDSVAEPEEYEVEKIIDHKIKKVRKTKTFLYYIKWLNYGEADNTWEKESNVFAVDLIAAYWNKISSDNADRKLFEFQQSKKALPILLEQPKKKENSPPKVAKVITASSPSPPSSPTSSPTLEPACVPNTLTSKISSFFTPSPKPVSSAVASTSKLSKEVIKEPSTVSIKSKEKEGQLPTVTAVDSSDEEHPKRKATRYTVNESDQDEDEEVTIIEKNTTGKRTRTTYTDYFTEEHLKKKKKIEGGAKSSDEDVTENEVFESASSSEAIQPESDDLKETDEIIFDESYERNKKTNWEENAVKIEYIGREVENAPIYCAVKWTDGVRSFHAVDLVRKKRPDLVIDALLARVYPKGD